MAKASNSVIGVDIGRYSLKSVLMQRKAANRYVVTNFATRSSADSMDTPDVLSRELKALLKDMGGTAKNCAIAVSYPGALLRIIEQPDTPPHILRDAVRLNGMALLNMDCKDYVLDCDKMPMTNPVAQSDDGPKRYRYLVGGLPRKEVVEIGEVFEKSGATVGALQLGPIASFNAFEFANPETFNNEAFFLVDIGHMTTTVMVGSKRELVLVRNIEFGGQPLFDGLTALSGEDYETVFKAIEQEDEVMVEYTRVAMTALVREIQNSIGYLEHRHEQTVRQLYISGGVAKSRTLLKVLSEELHLPCETWNAVAKCEAALPANQADAYAQDAMDLNVACGAAAELLKGN